MRDHLEAVLDFEVTVREGVVMLPADVAADDPVVETLTGAVRAGGGSSEPVFAPNTFDAGYGCAQGIPTVMFGPGTRTFGSRHDRHRVGLHRRLPPRRRRPHGIGRPLV